MAVDAAYLEPTIEFVTTSVQSSGAPPIGLEAWGTDVLAPVRRDMVRLHVPVTKSSPSNEAKAASLPSYTVEKRALARSAPVAGMPSGNYEQLAREHGELAAKQFDEGGLTADEQRQLRMMKWALDTIEMEQMEPSLRRLQDLAQMHRKLQREVDRLVAVVR